MSDDVVPDVVRDDLSCTEPLVVWLGDTLVTKLSEIGNHLETDSTTSDQPWHIGEVELCLIDDVRCVAPWTCRLCVPQDILRSISEQKYV